MCGGTSHSSSRSGRSDHAARPVELVTIAPLRSSLPYSRPASSHRTQHPSLSSSLAHVQTIAPAASSSQSSNGRRRSVDWESGGQVRERYDAYKTADKAHGAALKHYRGERKKRLVVASPNRPVSPTFEPDGLTAESHEYLAPKAAKWKHRATDHAVLREDFLTDYPRAYGDQEAVNGHRIVIQNAQRSARDADHALNRHIHFGSSGQFVDPYDNLDMRTGGAAIKGQARAVYHYR